MSPGPVATRKPAPGRRPVQDDGLTAALLDVATDALIALAETDGDPVVLLANPAARTLLDAEPGQRLLDIPGLGGSRVLVERLRQAGHAGEETTAPDGTRLRLTLRRSAGHLLLTARDITREHRLAADVRAVQDRFDLAVRAAQDGIWDWDLTRDTIWFSPQWKAHFGYADHELSNTLDSWGALIFPEDREQALALVDAYLSGAAPRFEAIQRFRHKDGHTVLVYTRAIKEVDAFGCPVRLIGANTDITNLEQMEAALRNAEGRLVDAIGRLNDGFILYDAEDRVVLTNSRFQEYYPELAPFVRAGVTFEQMVREAVRLGSLKIPDGMDKERFIAERLERHRNPGPSFERTLPGGRVIRVTEYPTAEGGIVSLGVDVTELRASETLLRDREAILRYTAGLAGLGYWVWDAEEQRTVTCSAELAVIRGGDPEGCLARLGRDEAMLDAVHPDDRDYYRIHAMEVARSDRSYVVEYRLLRPDGASRHVREVGGPVLGADGRVVKYVVAVQDTTERKQRELELEEARDRLELQASEMTALARELEGARDAAEAASRAKSRFLAVMSHELRTPMTGVIGMIDLMRATPLSPDQGRYLGTLRSSADSLLVVLNDILDFSKIEAGQLTLEDIPLKVPALVEDVIRLFLPAADQKGVALACVLPPGPVPEVTGDPTRLRQVLLNLVGNAVKFTNSGRIAVRLTGSEPDGPGHLRLRFEVEDTGVGISPEIRPVLFEAFTQADASTTRKFGGTGLGLAICKRLVGMMGGSIGVESETGRGSRFWFTVRMALARPADAAIAAPPADPPPHGAADTPVRILLAEDNHVNRLLIVTMLERMGYRVGAVANGLEAVEAARGGGFDIILMDMQMPEMDGDAAAAAIRGMEGPAATVPIVALTADVMPEERNRRMNTRLFDEYVTKPIDWPRLNKVVAALAASGRLPGHPGPEA